MYICSRLLLLLLLLLLHFNILY